MTTKPAVRPPPASDYAHLEPLPDAPPYPDYDVKHYKQIARSDQTLETWLRHYGDAVVDGNMYLCFNRTDHPATWLAPDCFVAIGVDPAHLEVSNGYIINEVGKPPDLVIEVGSRSTGRRDYTFKRLRYAAFGIGEYWLYDPSGGNYYPYALIGFRLVNGQYELFEIHNDDGIIWGHSPLLGLDLCWVDGDLLFRNPATGEFLLTQPQLQDAFEAAREELIATQDVLAVAETRAHDAEAIAAVAANRAASAESRAAAEATRAADAESRADDAESRADNAETRATSAETRAATAEAEMERLRAILRRFKDSPAGSEPEQQLG